MPWQVLLLPQDKVEKSCEEAETEADPDQDEAVAVVPVSIERSGEARSVNGCSDQYAQPAEEHDAASDEEATALLQGEELGNEGHQGDAAEDDGQDHKCLDRLHSAFIVA